MLINVLGNSDSDLYPIDVLLDASRVKGSLCFQ